MYLKKNLGVKATCNLNAQIERTSHCEQTKLLFTTNQIRVHKISPQGRAFLSTGKLCQKQIAAVSVMVIG